jgi:hypothetical protein
LAGGGGRRPDRPARARAPAASPCIAQPSRRPLDQAAGRPGGGRDRRSAR